MSSGFVSGGTTDNPIERDDDWLKAQQEIEANRQRKEEEARSQGGKSLYEVLQNNKAAKQEAFEESIRLKNQFRTLDEDEVEFLDSVLESTRAKEDAVKKETTEQLELFRRQQDEADKANLKEADTETTTAPSPSERQSPDSPWAVNARKRKRAKYNDTIPGLKLRKSSSTAKEPASVSSAKSPTSPARAPSEKLRSAQKTEEVERPQGPQTGPSTSVGHPQTHPTTGPAKPQVGVLGLAAYSSDEDG
ncbi:MAG: hypothetical protein LQ348_006989 [Seirophora lacunosa]|nr:MAG: hypothetical protein LQ348_006989 [Seirophora lacunosa]